jgi:uncharacterized protein (TIGR02145 family)
MIIVQITALTVAPAGWHLPSDAEWTILTDFLGGESKAGGKMKATTFWVGANTGATNISGFTALPGGFSQADYVFDYIGFHGDWWSSTKSDPDFAWMRYIDAYPFGVVWRKYSPTIIALSVRCLRD